MRSPKHVRQHSSATFTNRKRASRRGERGPANWGGQDSGGHGARALLGKGRGGAPHTGAGAHDACGALTCRKRLRWTMSTSGSVHRLSVMLPCCSCLQCGQRQASSGASWKQGAASAPRGAPGASPGATRPPARAGAQVSAAQSPPTRSGGAASTAGDADHARAPRTRHTPCPDARPPVLGEHRRHPPGAGRGAAPNSPAVPLPPAPRPSKRPLSASCPAPPLRPHGPRLTSAPTPPPAITRTSSASPSSNRTPALRVRVRGASRRGRGESLNPLGRSELRQVWDLPHDEATGPRARSAVPTETEQREAKDGTAGRACFHGKHA